jgi:serine/threonine protein kinase
MDPNILDECNYNYKCDIWSVGIIYYEMIYGKTPWNARSERELLKNIQEQQPLYLDPNIPLSEQGKDLLRKMLNVSLEERIGFN